MPSAWTKPDSEKSTGRVASRGVPSAPEDFSLSVGGPLYQIYLRTRLARPPLELLRRRIIALSMICWLPLLVLSLAEGHAVSGVHVPFLLDIETYARFLVALPLLLVAEVVVHRRISPLILQFRKRDIISERDWGRFEAIVASTMRLRNSRIVEVILLVLSVTVSNWVWREYLALKAPTWYASPPGKEMHLTPSGFLYVAVILTISPFVLSHRLLRLLLFYHF